MYNLFVNITSDQSLPYFPDSLAYFTGVLHQTRMWSRNLELKPLFLHGWSAILLVYFSLDSHSHSCTSSSVDTPAAEIFVNAWASLLSIKVCHYRRKTALLLLKDGFLDISELSLEITIEKLKFSLMKMKVKVKAFWNLMLWLCNY